MFFTSQSDNLFCVVMVQVSYIPRCRVMFDLHNLGASGPRLCKSRITLHLNWYVTYTYTFLHVIMHAYKHNGMMVKTIQAVP